MGFEDYRSLSFWWDSETRRTLPESDQAVLVQFSIERDAADAKFDGRAQAIVAALVKDFEDQVPLGVPLSAGQ